MAFNQRLEIEAVINGGLLGAFRWPMVESAEDFCKTYLKSNGRPIALLFEGTNPEKKVRVKLFFPSGQTQEEILDSYEDAWIWAQQQLRGT
jgi:hypothetical protein